MKIAQHFQWNAAHRLLRGDGALHSHAYRLTVELEGPHEALGYFGTLDAFLTPLLCSWEGAVLVASEDSTLLDDVQQAGQKHALVPVETTAENLSRYVADYVCMMAAQRLRIYGIEAVSVRVEEARAAAEAPHPADAGHTRTRLRDGRFDA